MTDVIFLIWGKLGKSFSQWGIIKYGVIPESFLAFLFEGDDPIGMFLDLCDDLSAARQDHAGYEPSVPFFRRDSVQELKNFLQIIFIGRVRPGKP